MNTDVSGVSKIQENTEALQQEFDKLASEINDVRMAITSQITAVEDTRKSLKLFASWLQEVEEKTAADTSARSLELPEKRARLEKYKTIQKDVVAHRAAAEELQKLPLEIHTDVPPLLTRYEELATVVAQTVNDLEQKIEQHEKFKAAYQQACDWLTKTKLDLQECTDCVGEETIIKNKLERLSDVETKVTEGESLIVHAKQCGEQLLQSKMQNGDDSKLESVQQDCEFLDQEWEHVKSMIISAHKALTHCLECWEDFEKLYDDLHDWLINFKDVVQSEVQLQDKSEAKTVDHLNKCKVMLTRATFNDVTSAGG